jgi:hypothetical protein
MQAILYILAACNGVLMGGLVVGYPIFEYGVLPLKHPLIVPLLVIGATLGGLTAWLIEPDYLETVVLIESIVNIALATHKIRDGRAVHNK